MNEIDKTKNMIVYDDANGLYFEHNNHDNSCYLYGYMILKEFSGSLDIHQDIIDWINNSKEYNFDDDLKDYIESL